MPQLAATDQYNKALKLGQREYKERMAEGLPPYPAVLDEIIDPAEHSAVAVGLVEVPTDRVVGIKSAGRIAAFSAGFYPLLQPNSEFAGKWMALCSAHLSDTGIRDPIVCFEYLGNFYVQEGNKRVSVLKSFDAPRIPANVTRILPKESSEPRIRAYNEFLDFFKKTGLYCVQFTEPGGYAKLYTAMGKDADSEWSDAEKRSLTASMQYFKEAFYACGGKTLGVEPEEALLRWLKVYSYKEISAMSSAELKKSVGNMWRNIAALAEPSPVDVRTEPTAAKEKGIISMLISPSKDHLDVAFVHSRNILNSDWVQAHELGRQEMSEALGARVTSRSYFDASTPEKAQELLERAVAEGADVIFTTAAQLTEPSLKLSVRYPKLHVYNCAVNIPYPSLRTYYTRLYEGKFITGAIAGAMSPDGLIGYVSPYPIMGELASINAFTLGAQLTNPRAHVRLEWSCLPGGCVGALIEAGARVVCNREVPVADKFQPVYGTYYLGEGHELIPLASPCCNWGDFYTKLVTNILDGTEPHLKGSPRAVNYWWGMKNGAIDVTFSDRLPEGVRALAEILRGGILSGDIDPFLRRIHAQDGSLKSDGTHVFTPEELLKMDFLCFGVEGRIPKWEELLPMARPMVRLLGIYRDSIPAEEKDT